MIKISIQQLDQNGIDIDGTEPSSFLGITDSLISFPDGVSYNLHASLVKNSGVLVNGTISTTVSTACARCLEPFTKEMSNSEICRYYEKVSTSELDITEDMREEILITFPFSWICDTQCKGLCPGCSCNLNIKKCNCPEKIEEESIWSDLDNFKG